MMVYLSFNEQRYLLAKPVKNIIFLLPIPSRISGIDLKKHVQLPMPSILFL